MTTFDRCSQNLTPGTIIHNKSKVDQNIRFSPSFIVIDAAAQSALVINKQGEAEWKCISYTRKLSRDYCGKSSVSVCNT